MPAEVVRKREHESFELPAEKFLVDGQLQLYEETQSRGYFQIRANGDKLLFQAGGFIGLIPVNDRITIEVAPRTPIGNLDRILQIGKADPAVIKRISRSYSETEEKLSLIDVLCDEFLDAMEQIALDGRMKIYVGAVHSGQPRAGRILMNETLRQRAAHPGRVLVVSRRYERTSDNIYNACLKRALEVLASHLQSGPPKKGGVARLRRLNSSWILVENADERLADAQAVEQIRAWLSLVPSEPYKRALAIAVALLSSRRPSARLGDGHLTLSSVIYDLSTAFEAYVRNVLGRTDDAAVLDGNIAAPSGGKRVLFKNPINEEVAKIAATPDVVLIDAGTAWCAIDVKYKQYASSPGRDDLNQVLTYGLTHEVDTCVLVYPATTTLQGLVKVGSVGAKSVYAYGIPLAAADLEAEETAMATAIFGLH